MAELSIAGNVCHQRQPTVVGESYDYRREIAIRPATSEDLPEVLRVCNIAWKGIWEGDLAMFQSRIQTVPEAGIVVATINGNIEAYVSLQITDEQTTLLPDWDSATCNGYLLDTHNPNGQWVHCVGLAATPLGSQHGLISRLVQFSTEFMTRHNKKGGRFITRMPGYYRRKFMRPEEYAQARRSNKPFDPELRVFWNHGLRVTSPPLIFKNYLKGGGDPDSLGYSVLIEHLNPFYRD